MIFEILPYVQCKETAGVHLMQEEAKLHFLKEQKKLNDIVLDDDHLKSSFKMFVNQKLLKTYNIYIEPHSIKPLHLLQVHGLLPSLLTKRKRRLYLNLIKCEAHRDVLFEILDNDSNPKK
jgi:poly-gamma-glutamate synthesis protein (capsule biosynthesis protein)